MKKILLFIMTFILFINVKALEIDKMYIDSELDISGNLMVKEIIEIDNLDEDFNYKLYFKDMNLKLKGKNYYDGVNIKINKIGLLNEDYDLNKLNNEEFDSYVKESDNVTYNNNDNNVLINVKKSDSKLYLYIDYTVLSLSVLHNDVSEFYYKYLCNLEYDIKELKIIFKLPFSSDIFDVYAHSKMKANISKDDSNYLVIIQKKDYKKGNDLDLRVLYDSDLYAVIYNNDKKSNMDAYNIIKEIEDERLNNTKMGNIFLYVLIALMIILVVIILVFVIKYKRKRK